jgi:hypothetical protein
VTPFRGDIELVENRANRADRHTIRAVDTGGWIDEILLYSVGCGNTINRADFHTGSIFNPGTWFCYYVGHSNLLALKFEDLFSSSDAMISQNRPMNLYIFKSATYFVKG